MNGQTFSTMSVLQGMTDRLWSTNRTSRSTCAFCVFLHRAKNMDSHSNFSSAQMEEGLDSNCWLEDLAAFTVNPFGNQPSGKK